MNIYLDCDEVLLDTAHRHYQIINQKFGIVEDYINKYPSQWNFDHKELDSYAKSSEIFTKSYEFCSVDPMPYAIEGISRLKQANFNLFIVSSISEDPMAKMYRKKNLSHVFGDVFNDITCLPLGYNNKKEYYKKAPKGIVIDDSYHNVLDALECGHKAILIAIPQNENWQKEAEKNGIIIQNNLLEAANFVINKHHFNNINKFNLNKIRQGYR